MFYPGWRINLVGGIDHQLQLFDGRPLDGLIIQRI
jgi:hypothetical protein